MLYVTPLFADIEFSDFLFPLEKTSYFGWKGFQDEMPNLFKKAKTITIESGNTFFYGSGGRLQLELKIDQTLNTERTLRTITLTFTFPGNNEIKLSTLTEGHDLIKLPLEELRMGQLPFFPQKNEFLTRIDFLVSRMNQFSIVIHRNSLNTIQADFFSNNNSSYFLKYSEISTDTYREFTYTLLEEALFGEQQTLKVSKFIKPPMILGTEEYFIDDIQVSAKEYLDAFGGADADSLSLQGFIFGMWQVQFQQFIQHINF